MPAAVATEPGRSTASTVDESTRLLADPPSDADALRDGAPTAAVHRIRPVHVLGVALIAVVLFAVGIASMVEHRGSFGGLFGDRAVLALTARDAWGAPALVGPYSRFYWHHPGPAYFYVLGTWRAVFGDSTLAFELGAVAINVAATFGVLLLAFRRGGAALLAWTSLLLALYFVAIGPVAFDLWNPSVTLLPFALVVMLAWSVACCDWWAAPVLAAVASFTVQTHVGLAAGVLAACVYAVLVAAWQRRRLPAGDRARPGPSLRWPLVASGAVMVVCWLPPVIEQCTRPDGNLGELVRFFVDSGSPHGLSEGIARTAAQSTLLVRSTFDGATLRFGTDQGLALGLAVSGVALVVAVWLATRARSRVTLVLFGLVAVELVVGAYSVTRIVGPVQFYLVQWLSAVGLLFWIGVGHAVLVGVPERMRPRSVASAAGVGIALVLAGTVALTSGMGSAASARAANEDLAVAHNREVFGAVPLADLLSATRVDRVVVLRLDDDSAWEILAADALQLAQRGRDVKIVASPVTRLLFDEELIVPRSSAAPTLAFESKEDGTRLRGRASVVATQGRWRIVAPESR